MGALVGLIWLQIKYSDSLVTAPAHWLRLFRQCRSPDVGIKKWPHQLMCIHYSMRWRSGIRPMGALKQNGVFNLIQRGRLTRSIVSPANSPKSTDVRSGSQLEASPPSKIGSTVMGSVVSDVHLPLNTFAQWKHIRAQIKFQCHNGIQWLNLIPANANR